MKNLILVILLHISFVLGVFYLAFVNRLGDAMLAVWLGGALVAAVSILALRSNGLRTVALAIIDVVLSMLSFALAADLNGYNDPPLLSQLGLSVLGVYFILPVLAVWTFAYVVIWLARRQGLLKHI
jgi:hypothetical protein